MECRQCRSPTTPIRNERIKEKAQCHRITGPHLDAHALEIVQAIFKALHISAMSQLVGQRIVLEQGILTLEVSQLTGQGCTAQKGPDVRWHCRSWDRR